MLRLLRRRNFDRYHRWLLLLGILLLFCLVLNRRTVWLAIAVGVASHGVRTR
jgi:hypothetical protein